MKTNNIDSKNRTQQFNNQYKETYLPSQISFVSSGEYSPLDQNNQDKEILKRKKKKRKGRKL